MKLSFKTEIFSWLLLTASVVLGFYFYSKFPEQVVTHWNFQGEPDGYSSRFWGAFLFPLVLIGMYLLFVGLPWLDPKRARYQEFAKTYSIFRHVILAAMFVIFLLAGFYNLGYDIDIGKAVPMLIGVLFLVMGNYMGKLKSNWFMGIRTPWTLSSETVWNKTQRFGGRMMMLFGLAIFASPFLPKTWGMALFIAGMVLVIFGSFIYSYWLYRQEQK